MSQTQKVQGLNGPNSSAAASALAFTPQQPDTTGQTPSKASSIKSSTKKDKKEVSLLTGLPYNTPHQKDLLDKCDWQNRLIYASRMLLGGNSVNGFLRGTATAQRIKKQRARQVGITKKTAAAQAAVSIPEPVESDKKDKKSSYHNEEEEQLKKGIL